MSRRFTVDEAAGSILSMFNFRSYNRPLFLNPSTGEPVSAPRAAAHQSGLSAALSGG